MSLSLITAIAGPLLDIIDKIVPDKGQAAEIKSALSTQLLSNNSEISKAASEVIVAEAKGESWLQRNWRPMAMLWFLFLIGAYWFGFAAVGMATSTVDQMFTLVQIGLGGYVGGRSLEKVANAIAPALGKK